MRDASRLPKPRTGFTLVELLVVIALILAVAAIGLGYALFGQSNQHSYTAGQAVTGAMLNAKQRARRDGVPTGIRILFDPTTNQASQIQLVQQPEDYSLGQMNTYTPPAMPPYQVTFNVNSGADFQGGAEYVGQVDESTVLAGDYFWLPGTQSAHLITQVQQSPAPPASAQQWVLTLASSPSGTAIPAGTPYAIHRGPRRLPSEDVIKLPPSVVIDDNTLGGTTLCQNLPMRTMTDWGQNQNTPTPVQFAEISFAPSGAVVGQGTGADKVILWLRDPSQADPRAGAPLLVTVQIRTGLISVYPVAPWNPANPIGPGNDPYAYAKDGRASGM